MKFNRKTFFKGFRELVDPSIAQEQVDGLEFLLGKMESDPAWKSIPHAAYALATVFHETAGSMQPVEEGYYLGSAAKVKAFQKSLRYFPYFGRGYVQLTWKKNYDRAGKAFGLDLVNNPDEALNPKVAYFTLTRGMHNGWFTGKKLSDYISDTGKDYVHARKIINGLDKAGLIAGYARSFETILRASAAASPDNSPISTQQMAGEIAPKPPAAESPTNEQPPINPEPENASTSGAAPNASTDDKALSPQVIDKEKPSTFVKWMTAVKVAIGTVIAGLSAYCGGTEVQTIVAKGAVDKADSSILPTLILVLIGTFAFVLAGVFLIWIASLFYDRSASRATTRNLQKVEKAASPVENTVEYKK